MRIRSILLLTALLVAACSKPAPPTLPWERISPLPTDADLHALAAARGRTVAAGEGGTILTSTDGETWTLRPTGTTDDLFGVTAAPAGWVAVGDGAILTSPDAVTWTPRTGAANKDLRAVACGPQTCVAVGDKGAAVAEKPSGKWAPVAMGTENDLLSVAYANGKFIATGARGTALASADGQAWTPLKPPLPEPPQGFYNDLVSVMFTQDTWVIGVAGWGSFVLTSRDDGETWDLREAGQDYSRLWAANGSKLLRMSFREKKPSSTLTSADLGATWQSQTTNLTAFPYVRALTWDGTQFLAAGEDGIIRASADGVTWEDRLPRGHRQDWTDLAFGDGRFVALANGDVAISADGLTWDLQPRPKPEPLYLRSIVRGPDRFVATGLGVYTSVDGVTWKQQVPADWPLSSVVWGSGRYVAIRHNETVASLDGTVWQVGPALGPERYLQGIVAGDTGFVAYGQSINGKDNEIYTSADGLTWTSQGLQPLIWSITYGKGLYVAFTISGNVITSPDGRIWTETKPPVREGVHVFFTGDQFVGMGTESVLLSADGRTWKVDGRQPARHGISNMAFGHGRLVAVGGAGSIIVATPVLAK